MRETWLQGMWKELRGVYLIGMNCESKCSALLWQAEHVSPGISVLNGLSFPFPVFYSGSEHGHPATPRDQGRDPRPCSLHRRNMCAHYWLHWHHWKPPSSLCILQVQKFLLWLIWLALRFTCSCVQMLCIGYLLDQISEQRLMATNGVGESSPSPPSTHTTDNLSVNSSCFKESEKINTLFYKQFQLKV